MTKFPLSPAVGGLPTFYGAYLLNKQRLTEDRGWNEMTLKEYESSLVNIICPNIKDHNIRPLSTYTQVDVDATIKTIKANGYLKKTEGISQYDQSTLERFRYLMEVVIDAAVENFDCPDILQKQKRRLETIVTSDRRPIPRSMSPEQEKRVGEILLTDPMQSGAFMALATMFCAGTRNAEACGLNFGDVRLWKDIPGLWVAWIFKTTKIDSDQLQSSGKTRNADRVVVLPDRFVWLVNERKQWLQEQLEGVNVDQLPIACVGNDYFRRCKADDVTEAARELFRMAGILPEQVCEAFDTVRRGDLDDMDQIEKTPTAYYLRRHYGTALAAVGLTEQEICFQIGHEMAGPVETRNEFLCDERLKTIKQKIDCRAVVNENPGEENHLYLTLGKTARIDGSGRQVIHIPSGTKGVVLQLEGMEPMDQLHVRIRNPSGNPTEVDVTTAYNHSPNDSDPNVQQDYQKLYSYEGGTDDCCGVE